jgi:hypothetical protein
MSAPEALMIGLTAGVIVGGLLTWLIARGRTAALRARAQELTDDRVRAELAARAAELHRATERLDEFTAAIRSSLHSVGDRG